VKSGISEVSQGNKTVFLVSSGIEGLRMREGRPFEGEGDFERVSGNKSTLGVRVESNRLVQEVVQQYLSNQRHQIGIVVSENAGCGGYWLLGGRRGGHTHTLSTWPPPSSCVQAMTCTGWRPEDRPQC
jgi:hypothetical protein